MGAQSFVPESWGLGGHPWQETCAGIKDLWVLWTLHLSPVRFSTSLQMSLVKPGGAPRLFLILCLTCLVPGSKSAQKSSREKLDWEKRAVEILQWLSANRASRIMCQTGGRNPNPYPQSPPPCKCISQLTSCLCLFDAKGSETRWPVAPTGLRRRGWTLNPKFRVGLPSLMFGCEF